MILGLYSLVYIIYIWFSRGYVYDPAVHHSKYKIINPMVLMHLVACVNIFDEVLFGVNFLFFGSSGLYLLN